METRALEIVRELLGGPACEHIDTIRVTTRYGLVNPEQGWKSGIDMQATYVVQSVSSGKQSIQALIAVFDRIGVDWYVKGDGKFVFIEESVV